MARLDSTETVHATSVAIDGRAVLLFGASGMGKSDLALRLIDRGATLISDDYTVVTSVNQTLQASAPATIVGKMEVRGIGVVDMPNIGHAPVALLVDLTQDVQRLPPDPTSRAIAGSAVPVVSIAPFEASAPIKVELALKTMGLP